MHRNFFRMWAEVSISWLMSNKAISIGLKTLIEGESQSSVFGDLLAYLYLNGLSNGIALRSSCDLF